MPDSLKKRGKHPADQASFHPDLIPDLLEAASDYSWLKSRGYADGSTLKLVGDRFNLNSRQRSAIARSTCSEAALFSRRERLLPHSAARGATLHIDGFNLLISIEAFLGNGILLIGQDGCLRDMSSMHGNYRVLADTDVALTIISDFLAGFEPKTIRWLLDKPVSNSGRLKAKILNLAQAYQNTQCGCEVELITDPDPVLKAIPQSRSDLIITADSDILNHCGYWLNTAREIVQSQPGIEDRILVNFES